MGSSLDEEKTYTQLAFVPLLTADISIKSTKKQVNFMTDSMQDFNTGYWRWKHDYRANYSKKFLEKYGFEPETSGEELRMDTAEVDRYMKTIDIDYFSSMSTGIGIAGADLQIRFHLQNTYGSDWSNESKKLIIGPDEYTMVRVSYKEDPDPYVEDTQAIVVGYFTSTTQPNMIIEINNLYPGTSIFTSIYYREDPATATDYYIFLEHSALVPGSIWDPLKSVGISPVIPLKEKGIIIPETKPLKRMMRKLNVDAEAFEETLSETDDDGEPSIDNAYLVNGLPMRNPYEVKVGQYDPTEAEKLPYALLSEAERRGNSNGEDNNTSYNITQDLVTWFYSKHLKEQAYMARALFKTFAYYAGAMDEKYSDSKRTSSSYLGNVVNDFSGRVGNPVVPPTNIHEIALSAIPSGGLQITKDGATFHYNYDIKVKTFTGRVRPGRKSSKSQCSFHFSGRVFGPEYADDDGDMKRDSHDTWDSEGYDKLEIKVQIDENHYQIMTIKNYRCAYYLFGQSNEPGRIITVAMGYPMDEHRVIIPYFVLHYVPFNEYVTVYEQSFMFMAYAVKTVVIKFWKKVVGFLIGAVICFLTAGSGCSIGLLIFQAIVAYVVGKIIMHIVSMIDSEILKLVIQIVGMLVQMYIGGFDFSIMTSEVYLKLATQIASMAYDAYTVHIAKEIALEEKQVEAQERIDEKIEAGDSQMELNIPAILSAHSTFESQVDPNAYYTDALGNTLYNFEQYYDIDSQIEFRKQVKSG